MNKELSNCLCHGDKLLKWCIIEWIANKQAELQINKLEWPSDVKVFHRKFSKVDRKINEPLII